jgi:hypothetical protein
MSLDGKQIFDDINAAVAVVPHQQTTVIPTATFSPVFELYLYNSCFSAVNAGANSHAVASLRNSADVLMANFVGDADSNGYLFGCFRYIGPSTNVLPSYKLKFMVYNQVGGTLLGTYSATARNIVFSAIDLANSVVSGTALANKPYSISWYQQKLDASRSYKSVNLTGTVSGAATWSVDFGTTPIRGNDYLNIHVTQSNRFIFYRDLSVPHAYCQLGANTCGIFGFPLQPASLTITHASVPYTFTGKFNAWGWFIANLVDNNDVPILLVPGDTVSGTGVITYTLPNLTTYAHYSTDIITGKVPANKYFNLDVYDVYADYWYSVWAHSDVTGNYSANFSSLFDLKASDILSFTIYYDDPATGNSTIRYFPVGP